MSSVGYEKLFNFGHTKLGGKSLPTCILESNRLTGYYIKGLQVQKKFLRTAFYGIQTKEHKQENLSSRKRRRFKQELKAEEGEESPLKSWVKVQRLNTQYGRTQTVSAIWFKDSQKGERWGCKADGGSIKGPPCSDIWSHFKNHQIPF